MPAPWTFGTDAGPIPLSKLDDNFAYYSQLIHLTVDGTGTISKPNYAAQLQVQINNFSWYSLISSGLPGDLYGCAANLTRTASGGTTVGGFFSALGNSGVASEIWGVVTQAIAQPGCTSTLVAGEHGLGNQTNNNTSQKAGLYVVFKDRPDGQPGTTQALGADQFNAETKAIWIASQPRSTTGEKCGWRRGLYFDEFAMDADYHGAAIGIDFAYVHYYGGSDPLTAYRMTAAIRMRDYQSVLWNGDPTLPNDPTEPAAPIRTLFASALAPAGRWILSNTAAERFGIDVNTGELYVNGKLPVGFRVHKNGVDQGSITSGGFTKVTFSTATFDNNTDYNTGTNRFVPPPNTTCKLTATVQLQGAIAPCRMVVAIYKNGSIYQTQSALDSVGISRPFGATVDVTVRQPNGGTDFYEVYVYQDSGSTLTVGGGVQDTSFCAITAH